MERWWFVVSILYIVYYNIRKAYVGPLLVRRGVIHLGDQM